MYSVQVSPGQPATAQQYNKLRDDARGGSYLQPHQQDTPDMTVRVEDGFFFDNSATLVEFSGGNATIAAASGSPRYDLVVVTTAGAIQVTQGTPSGSPVKPPLNTSDFPVCYVYVRPGGTSIKTYDDSTNHYIIDIRVILALPSNNSAAAIYTQTFTADGTQTDFTVTSGTPYFVQVENSAKISGVEYTQSGAVVTFATAPDSGDRIVIHSNTGGTVVTVHSFTGDNTATVFTVPSGSVFAVQVENSMKIPTIEYTVSGSNVTFTAAPSTSDKIFIYTM